MAEQSNGRCEGRSYSQEEETRHKGLQPREKGEKTLWLTELKQDSRKDSNKATVKQDKNVKDKTNTTTRTMSRLSEQEKGAARDTREVIVMEHDIKSGVKTETSKETAA